MKIGMRTVLLACTILTLTFGLNSRILSQSGGVVDFAESKFDFGEIKEEDGPVSHVFVFQNTGKKSVSLESVKTTCGCTVSAYSTDSVRSGSSGMVKLTFDPTGRPGLFVKEATVQSNGQPAVQTLRISGKVLPRPKGPKDFYPFEEGGLRFQTNHLTYGRVYKDESPTLSTVVYNQGSKPIKFIPPKSKVPAHLKPKLSKTELMPGDTATIWVTYLGSLKDDWGFAFDNILLASTDAASPLKKLNISANVCERFPKTGPEADRPPKAKFDVTEVELGKVEEGTFPEAKFTITNTGGHPLYFRKVSSGCTCITPAISSTRIEPGETGTITAKFNTRGRIGLQEKEVVVICNDPSRPEVTLRITSQVFRVSETEGE